MMAGFVELMNDVDQRLAASTEEQLLKAAVELKLPEEDVGKAKSKGRTGLKRVIRRFLYREELEDSEDEGESVWQGVAKILGKVDKDGDEHVVELKARTTELPRDPPSQPEPDQPAEEEAEDTLKRSPILKRTNQLPTTTGDQETSAQRWKTTVREAYDLAKQTSQAKAEATKKTRDQGLHPLPLEQGDRVLNADLYDPEDCSPPQQNRRKPPRMRQPPPVLTYTQLGEPQQWRRDPNVNMVQAELQRMDRQPGLYYPHPHQRMMHQADPWPWDAGLPRGQQQVRIPNEMPSFISRPAWDTEQFQQWQPWMTKTTAPQSTFSQRTPVNI